MYNTNKETECLCKRRKRFYGYFLLFVTTIVWILAGCSDEPNAPNTKPDESITDSIAVLQNNEAFNDMRQWLEKNDALSIQQIMDYAKRMQNVEKVQVADSVIDVHTKNGYFFQIDIGDSIQYQEPVLDEAAFDKWLEEQDAINGYITDEDAQSSSDFFGDIIGSDDDDVEAISIKNTPMMYGQSRAAYQRKVLLWRKKDLLVWCPWIEFSGDKSYIGKLVTKLNNKLKSERRRPINLRILKNGDFGPGTFLQFGKYDMVFVSCHGTGRGNLCVPFHALSKNDSIQYAREVNAKRAGYCMTYISKADRKAGKVTKSGFSLFNSFFTKYLPKLDRTMIWAFACNAGKPNAYSFHKSVVEHNVAKYFASTSNCGGSSVLNEFANFYAGLLNGKSADRAFCGGKQYFKSSFWTEEKGGAKKIEFNFYQFRDNYVCYVMPRATGMRMPISVRANGPQLRDVSDSDVVVGGQIRYGVNPELSGDKSQLGVCLKNVDTGLVQYIPLSDENLISSSSRIIGDDIKINDFEIRLSGLPSKTRFVYAFYATDSGQIILSDECYEFTTPDYYGNLNKMEIIVKTLPDTDNWVSIFRFGDSYLDQDDTFENLLKRFYDIGFVAIDYGDGKGIQPFDASKYANEFGVIGYNHSYTYPSSGTYKVSLYYKNALKELFGFEYSSILSITIPNTVERIGNAAFANGRFILRQVIIPEGVKYIGRSAFEDTPIESLVLPNSVEIIDTHAFSDCNLNGHLIIPDGVKEIRSFAFSGNPFDSIELGSNVRYEDAYWHYNLHIVRCHMPSPPKPFSIKYSFGELNNSNEYVLYVPKQHLNTYLIDFYQDYPIGVCDDALDYANKWKDQDGNYTYFGKFKIIPF